MKRRAFLAMTVSAGIASVDTFAQAPSDSPRRFQDAKQWAGRFDDPQRDTWQKPQEVIAALHLKPDAVVADIGAGTGYFATRLAKAVPQGRVYAVDVEPEMVRYLDERARREDIKNMRAIFANRDDPNLPEPVDAALFVNVQGLMVDPGEYFARLRKSLKPGARVAILSTRIDSPTGARRDMRVSPEKVKIDMARQGYALIAEHDFVPTQFFLIFTPRS